MGMTCWEPALLLQLLQGGMCMPHFPVHAFFFQVETVELNVFHGWKT